MSLRVNIEDLAASGVAVTGHGEALHASAHGFAAMEQRHSQALETLAQTANSIATGTAR